MAVIDAIRPVETAVPGPARTPSKDRYVGRSKARLVAAAALTAAAGVVHLGQARGHFAEFPLFGALFLIAGLAQLLLATAILARPRGRLFVIAAAATPGLIGVWVMSRTVGLPIGPTPWWPEIPGFLDMLTTLSEIVSVILFVLLIRAPRSGKQRGPIRVTLAVLPAAILSLALSVIGTVAVFTPMPDAFNAAPALPGRASTSITSLVAPAGAEPVHAYTLNAGPLTVDGKPAYGYNGTVPGPELRVTQGERVKVTLVNRLPEATSIHWHGVNLPNAMDGVSGVTQEAVAPGGTFVYEFVATEPGTYWYHAHQRANEQISRGLYGAFTIVPRVGVPEQRDYSVVVHSGIGTSDVRINGGDKARLAALPGETVRLRIVNASIPSGFKGDPILPVLLGAPYRVVALDGHDLNHPSELGPQQVRLGMGQRADLSFTMPATGQVVLSGINGVQLFPFGPRPNSVILTLGDGSPPASPAKPATFDITSYGEPGLDPVAAASRFDVSRTLVLAGAPGFRNGTFDFTDTFSGATSPAVPPIVVHAGDLVKLHLVNPRVKYHPIHIHGHTFTVLSRNGHAVTGSPLHLDAVLMPPGETWDVAFKADNPGIWMLHCHVPAHAAAGMSMTVNYAGYSTPFSMGTSSGNEPE